MFIENKSVFKHLNVVATLNIWAIKIRHRKEENKIKNKKYLCIINIFKWFFSEGIYFLGKYYFVKRWNRMPKLLEEKKYFFFIQSCQFILV